ncbi:MAG: hypothetical protein EB015_18190, partial [Methylocystaceae bacterium]|nr:hypothetical protein [Methylocystaceae bacterium]
MKKVCVFGATSALGQVVTSFLEKLDWDITAFSRKDHPAHDNNIHWIKLPSELEQKIEFCLYLSPIKTFPDYFDMVQKLGVKSIILI